VDRAVSVKASSKAIMRRTVLASWPMTRSSGMPCSGTPPAESRVAASGTRYTSKPSEAMRSRKLVSAVDLPLYGPPVRAMR
jgi:hypothetical protein